jgi:hypothetical protein
VYVTLYGNSDFSALEYFINGSGSCRLRFVPSRSLFILKGHEAELNEYAGEKVIVAGAVSGNIVRVESVAPLDLVHGAASFE